MLHLIAYDICDAARLKKVAKVCELYGMRVEKSVFEADLTDEQFLDFWQELTEIIDEDEDSVINYQFCKSCVEKTMVAGRAVRPHKVVCYFI